jgi:hypothetical protein
MLSRVRSVWRRWRESRREYAIQRALYKAGGHDVGDDALLRTQALDDVGRLAVGGETETPRADD